MHELCHTGVRHRTMLGFEHIPILLRACTKTGVKLNSKRNYDILVCMAVCIGNATRKAKYELCSLREDVRCMA